MNHGLIKSYFKKEALTLTLVTVSGILYNVGLLAGPYFEGKLLDSIHDLLPLNSVLRTAIIFILFITATQIFRSIKRFYVRRFANNTLKSMRTRLYHTILLKSLAELEQENTGSLMSKATGDVDSCVEGMRKFTTEIFDTGVFMVSYMVMMLTYDVRLTLASFAFIALALLTAELMKKPVYVLTSAWRKSAADLNTKTFELIDHELLYRIYGRNKSNESNYDALLQSYAEKAAKAAVSENAMEPVYSAIVMGASVLIICFGAANVHSSFWTIGKFTAYLSLFAGLAGKASHAGKLFNSVQKASVSWKRIKPYLAESDSELNPCNASISAQAGKPLLEMSHFTFYLAPKKRLFADVTFTVKPGQIVGVTGPVACGKSVLAHILLGSEGMKLYQGSSFSGRIMIEGNEVQTLCMNDICQIVSPLFHNSALFSGTIYDNITLGKQGSVDEVLRAVCLDKDITQMKDGVQTVVGNGGIRLSGGQQSRLALARTLYHRKSLLVLDDPFAAVDASTESEIISNIRRMQQESEQPFAVILTSHRLEYFSLADSVVVMGNQGEPSVTGTHKQLLKKSPLYKSLYSEQQTGRK